MLEDVVDERAFPGAADAGDAHEQTQRQFDGDVFQIVMARSQDANALVRTRLALLRDLDSPGAGQVLSGDTAGSGDHIGIRAGRDDFAAAHAGTGTEIDEIVRGPHGLLVVFDDDDGIAHVAQPKKTSQQAFVVARMQTDARLIEDVQDADQAAADLAGQTDALGLASR